MMARTVDPELHALRRTTIVGAAATLFAEHGYDAVPVTAVAKAAGVSSGTVFHYFGDKRGLFRAIFENDLPETRAMIDRHRDDPDPLAAILAVVGELVEPAQDPAAAGLVVEVIRQVGHDPRLAAILEEDEHTVEEGLLHLLERARGEIDPALDPASTAAWIRAITDAAFLYADNPKAMSPTDTVRTIVLRYLTGHRKETS
ncbi:TetR/AcrR family transcriptional regulator [Rhodococcus sp. HNM0569]|uniref:TetR/AcrR family transcriptional regulator n=1 Tax=Rhodococcus sp. HNM0569 TaxID=2716340 RepID=UPI00146DD953|nr:TetR/AcrR family transcriptional regulator [Rhodococcus sp. HNM0569]NLU82246.1 TetR/AcrR family transcriptional regulator [Rhodococcus sp. HNM0569]